MTCHLYIESYINNLLISEKKEKKASIHIGNNHVIKLLIHFEKSF